MCYACYAGDYQGRPHPFRVPRKPCESSRRVGDLGGGEVGQNILGGSSASARSLSQADSYRRREDTTATLSGSRAELIFGSGVSPTAADLSRRVEDYSSKDSRANLEALCPPDLRPMPTDTTKMLHHLLSLALSIALFSNPME